MSSELARQNNNNEKQKQNVHELCKLGNLVYRRVDIFLISMCSIVEFPVI